MRDRLLKQTSREYGPKARLALLAVAGVVFLVILPWALVRLGGRLDRVLGWPALRYPPANAILGGLMILAGWLLGLWTNYVQFTLGRGTPVPVMATQQLIVSSPLLVLSQPDGPGRHRGLPGRLRGRRVAGRGAALAPSARSRC